LYFFGFSVLAIFSCWFVQCSRLQSLDAAGRASGLYLLGFTFLVPAHPGSPGKMAVKWVCVCSSWFHTVDQADF